MNRLGAVVEREGAVHGARILLTRGLTRGIRTANAAALGWRDGRLPLGSTILGARHISVGERFDAAGPVWMEAITTFAGRTFDPSIRIGDRFSTSGRLHVSAVECVEIGDDCLFGTNVYIGDHAHGALSGADQSPPTVAPRERPLRGRGPVRIGDRVWLGDNVVVLDGVRIGDGAVIGANSVVTSDIGSGVVAAGAPARPLKQFDIAAASWVPARDAHV